MGFPYPDDEDEEQPQVDLQADMTPYAQPEDQQQDAGDMSPAPTAAGAGATAGSPAKSLRDLILQKNQNVKDAQGRAYWGNALLGIGQSAENFARAPIIARGGAGANPGSYQDMANALNAQVGNAQADRASAIKGAQTENQLTKAAQAERLTADEADPNSERSKAFVASLKAVYPDLDIPAISVKDARASMPALLAKHEATQARTQSAQDKLTLLSEGQKNRDALLKSKVLEVSGQRQSAADAKAEKAAEKASADQEKTYSELVNRVNTPRGNQAVQAAMNGVVSGQKAQELIGQYAGNYDKMPPQQYHLLLEELGKMAHGGIPTEHGIESLDAGTLGEKYNRFLSQVGGEPSGAQVGAFIKENKRYIDGLTKLNQGVVDNYKRSIYKGYKNRLSSDQQKRFETDPDYADMFKNPAAQPAPATPQGGPGEAVAAPGGSAAPAAALHPQASAAEKWANANLMSPDAATATKAREILKRLGGGGQ